ncbi:MAG: methylenetetrahydrofolate reductase [Dehalococcoidia bacterium]|nr:methylenetetrahydrofolate reductase [Dehalococcoidia bacterium]MDZ4246233.1 methylenetetrahydrofolate reductase [Dehalococcoidia bacterium]
MNGSRLKQILSSGKFAVTAECGPPRGANTEVVRKKASFLKDCADAVNVTDNQTAIVRMSSLAACAHLMQMGIEPVLQMVTRDRNRIALQSDIMGAYSLGIRNILCLTGDHQTFGSQPDALNVFDIDSMNLLHAVRTMREVGTDMSGYKLDVAPRMFIGAAANPFADPFEYRVIRLAKKIAAGAEFIQTQCIYDMKRFKEWIKMAREQGLTEKVHILAGVTPLKSAGMAKYMAAKVPGMIVPEFLIKRMEGVPKEKAAEEGMKICLETIQEVRQIPEIHGVHIMAIEWEEKVQEIVKAAGLFPRPQPV